MIKSAAAFFLLYILPKNIPTYSKVKYRKLIYTVAGSATLKSSAIDQLGQHNGGRDSNNKITRIRSYHDSLINYDGTYYNHVNRKSDRYSNSSIKR